MKEINFNFRIIIKVNFKPSDIIGVSDWDLFGNDWNIFDMLQYNLNMAIECKYY
jgi:hypothetical protein